MMKLEKQQKPIVKVQEKRKKIKEEQVLFKDNSPDESEINPIHNNAENIAPDQAPAALRTPPAQTTKW